MHQSDSEHSASAQKQSKRGVAEIGLSGILIESPLYYNKLVNSKNEVLRHSEGQGLIGPSIMPEERGFSIMNLRHSNVLKVRKEF